MDHFTPKGGPRLHFEDAGGNGLPVVFQHGLCGDARQPAEIFPHVAAFRRITLECRGHGQSEAGPLDEFSIARFADDVAEMIVALALGPVVIGGISMGAAIAMRLVVTHPELIRALIIARPAWATDAAPENGRPNVEVGELLAQFPPEEARTRFEEGATAKRLAVESPDNLASLRGFFARQPTDVTSALLTRIASDGPGVTAQQLRNLTIPTLVIGHARDAIHPLAMAQDLSRLIPHAQLVEITPKAVDKPRYVADFQSALLAFLKGLS